MIRSLYNLTHHINKHILSLPIKKDFDLREVRPFIEKYNGNDWYEYKVKNSPLITTECMNNYMKIPINFKDLYDVAIDDIYGMYLIVWNPYCETSIHNHPEGGCLMKVLEGSILQHKFRNSELLTESEELKSGDVTYINDNIGLHRIINNNMNYAYSLHLYSPALLESEINKNTNQSKIFLPESKINHCLMITK